MLLLDHHVGEGLEFTGGQLGDHFLRRVVQRLERLGGHRPLLTEPPRQVRGGEAAGQTHEVAAGQDERVIPDRVHEQERSGARRRQRPSERRLTARGARRSIVRNCGMIPEMFTPLATTDSVTMK